MSAETQRNAVGLPARPFLYTLEQVATLTALTPRHLETVIHYDGRTLGVKRASTLMARNVAPPGEEPIWRVGETELIRWLRAHRFRVYERTTILH